MTTEELARQAADQLKAESPIGRAPYYSCDGVWLERFAALVRKQALEDAAKRCACGDRDKNDCPGEWEPGCDLGNNPAHVLVHHQTPEERDATRRALAATPAQASSTDAHGMTALERYADNGATDDLSPLEALRFFCSLAMNGRDWLDAEPFFDALEDCHKRPLGS
jgi:hypothetical protein